MDWIFKHSLDLTGPEFLVQFIVLAACAFVLAGAARLVLPRLMPVDGPTSELDLYEIAYLAGGPNRVLQTAVHELERSENLKVDDMRLKRRAGGKERGELHPLERDLLDGLAVNPTLGEVQRLAKTPVDKLTHRLEEKGYLLSGAGFRWVKGAIASPLIAWFGLGVAKLTIGLQLGRPILFLLILLAIGALGAFFLLRGSLHSSRSGKYLADLRSGHLEPAGLAAAALPIALVGLAAEDELRRTFFIPAVSTDSSDSGCGGDGGCGGGGCGGCGGCGG